MNLLREKLRALGHHCLYCSDGPDMSGVNRAAEASAALGQRAMDWYTAEYERTAPAREAASKLALEQAGLQTQLSRDQLETSGQERQRYNTTFKPIEERIATEAMEYDTPARREAAAAAARADVEQEVSLQRAGTTRSLERRGVMPGSGRSLAVQGSMDLGAAKLKAGAANTARQKVETVGAAKLADAAAMGRGVFTNQGTSASLALNAGNSSVNNGQVPVSVAGQGAAMMNQGFQTGMEGHRTSGNLYATAANAQGDDSGLWGAVGQIGGSLLAMSDKNEKTDVKPAKGEVALAAARRIPVKRWRYKKGSTANDGGKEHVGPMAQDVHTVLGEKAAPGGKQVDLISLAGVTLSAVKALDKKVDKLAKRRAH